MCVCLNIIYEAAVEKEAQYYKHLRCKNGHGEVAIHFRQGDPRTARDLEIMGYKLCCRLLSFLIERASVSSSSSSSSSFAPSTSFSRSEDSIAEQFIAISSFKGFFFKRLIIDMRHADFQSSSIDREVTRKALL